MAWFADFVQGSNGRPYRVLIWRGWMRSHIFTPGKGLRVVWTEAGFPRAVFLRMLVSECGLDTDDRAPECFDTSCRGGCLPDGALMLGDVDDETRALWVDLVDELGYAGSDDLLLGLVHVVFGWGPGGDTQVIG